MNCINITDQINCNIVENTAEYLIVNNAAGNMFSLTLNPDTGCSNDYAGIVIMNENLTDPVIVTATLENGMIIDVLATKPFSDTAEFRKQSYVYPLGMEVPSRPFYSKVVSQKLYFATDNPIPAGYIKFVFATKYAAASKFAAWIFVPNRMYVTDISTQWTKISNFSTATASVNEVGFQGAYQGFGYLFNNTSLIAADVSNNFPICTQSNPVIAQGNFNWLNTTDFWVVPVNRTETQLVTGIVNRGISLYYNNPCGGYPFNQGQVNAIFWSLGQVTPYEVEDFIYTDGSQGGSKLQYINRYTYAFDFYSNRSLFPLTFNKYGYMRFVNALRDYTFKMVNTFSSPFSLCAVGCGTQYSVCPWTLFAANGAVKSQGYTTTATSDRLNPPPTSTFEINVSKGESLIIGPYRPSVSAGSAFYFFGTITITQNSLMNVTPLPSGSPAPTQPTPTPTPSPSASPGPTPSPSGTEPTSTPFPTITPLPTILPGRMWMAGNNVNGQLGTNNEISYSSPVQSIVGGLWKSVEAGSEYFYNTIGAIKDDNTLWIWGQFNFSGVWLSSATQVVGGGSWLQISQNYALKADGTIWGWNLNQSGQPFGWASSPIQVTPLSNGWIAFNTNWAANLWSLIKNDRTLWMYGNNSYGQLGDGTKNLRNNPVQTVYRTNDWYKCVVNVYSTLALKFDGTLWGWGKNTNQYDLVGAGILGLNNAVNISTPTQVGTENNWKDIIFEKVISYGIKNDGTLWWIGGVGKSSPTQVLSDYNIKWKSLVSTGFQGSQKILLDELNNAWSWYADNTAGQMGNNETWLIGPPEPLQLFTAGSNTKWQTGTTNNLLRGVYPNNYNSAYTVLIEDVNPTVTPTNSPTPTATDPSPTPTPTIATATPTPSPSATPTSTPTLSPQPTPTPSFSMTPFPTESPTPSPSPTQKPFMIVTNDVLLNYSNSLKSTSQTIVYSNYEYKIAQPILDVSILSNGYLSMQIGGPQAPIIPVKGSLIINPTGNLADSIFIYLDTYNVISWSGQVFENGYINLILDQSPFTILTGTTGGIITFSTLPPSPTNTPLPTLPPLQQVNGNLFIWGNNSYGQLGNENTVPMSSPVQTLTTTSDWNSCDIKFNHVLSVKDNGQLWVWGNNAYGQLGLDNVTSLSSPVQLIGESNWNFVSAGYWFSLAVNNLGEVWSWGRNNYGQLGNVSIQDFSSPILVSTSAFGTCTKVSAGYSHAAAILSDDSLYMWGDNSYGACGFSDNLAISMPTQIFAGSLTDPNSAWKDVTCGKYFTLAVQKNGKLWAWGLNDNGQYGNNTTVTSSNPILIESSSSEWNFISAGEKFSVGGVDYPIGTPVPSMSPTPTATPSPT